MSATAAARAITLVIDLIIVDLEGAKGAGGDACPKREQTDEQTDEQPIGSGNASSHHCSALGSQCQYSALYCPKP